MVKRRRPLTEARLWTIARTFYAEMSGDCHCCHDPIRDSNKQVWQEIQRRQKARASALDWVEEQLERRA
jgi:hypothetical protein